MNFALFLVQYAEATDRAGVVNLTDWTTLLIRGADRTSFLHNMCTNDIRGLTVGDQCEAFLTDVKGKIVGHVIVFARDNELTLVTVPDQAERLIAHLDRYIIREDVQLVDATAGTRWSLVVGPHSAAVVRDVKEPTPAMPCVQMATPASWVGNLEEKPGDSAAKPQAVGEAVWHALRIESGWPLFGVDFDSSHLPQEVGRDDRAISFRKGCYLGQETVARIDALGHVNQRLATIRLDDAAAAGEELTAGDKTVGRITSVGYSPRAGAWLALAMVRRGHDDAGSRLHCRDLAAEVVPTPAVVA